VENLGVDGRIVLKWFFSKLGRNDRHCLSILGKRQVMGFYEHGNKLLATGWTVRKLNPGRGKRYLFSPRRPYLL
jgi:hypothetical protein